MGSLAYIAAIVCIHVACLLFTDGIKTPHAVCPPCTCGRDRRYGGVKANCTGLRLKSLPVRLPVNTTTLLLSNNLLKNLTDNMFQQLPNLHVLDVYNNSISVIHENAFHGLSKLKTLNLEYNHLILDSRTYHLNVFRDLTELKELRIVDNDDDTSRPHATYPDQSLKHLTSLKVLHLDGLPADFGPGFGRLKDLTNLTLSGKRGFCNVLMLQNSTFINVATVQNLRISSCSINNSDLLTFQPMKHIKSIDLSDNRHLGFTNFATASYGLQHSSLEILKINRVNPQYDVCTHLEAKHIQHLQNTSLKELHLDGNGIIGVENKAITTMPKNLEIISARDNKFQFGIYLFLGVKLTTLKFLDVSGINKMPPLPFLKRSVDARPLSLSLNSPIPVPPKLEVLIASECYFMGKITPGGLSKNNIKEVIVNDNFFTALNGPIAGLDKVEHFDMSNNILEEIGNEYFSENNSLAKLNLANNILGRAVAKDKEGYMFYNLSKVRLFDLSMNRIPFLPRQIFRGLKKVEVIILKDNYLESFEVNLPGTLKTLNLSGNKIQTLTRDVLKQMDDLPKLQIYLQYNPVSCTCQGLDFLKWLSENMHRVHGLESMLCELEPGHETFLTNFDVIFRTLEEKCNLGNTISLATSLSLFILVLGILGITIGYRHRWKIRYMYYVSTSRYRTQHAVDDDGKEFQYDVYVSYASSDRRFVIDSLLPELETNRELRVWIHDRDSIPGDPVAGTIVDVVTRSRKTLILLSPAFLATQWGEFVFNMALIEENDRRQSTVLVVMYKYVPVGDLWNDMSVMVRNNNYVEYTEDPHGNVVFWGNVFEAITLDL